MSLCLRNVNLYMQKKRLEASILKLSQFSSICDSRTKMIFVFFCGFSIFFSSSYLEKLFSYQKSIIKHYRTQKIRSKVICGVPGSWSSGCSELMLTMSKVFWLGQVRSQASKAAGNPLALLKTGLSNLEAADTGRIRGSKTDTVCFYLFSYGI